jgi:hypothetical protein
MAIFYHGSCRLFDSYDFAYAFEGAGYAKYGYGAYVTEAYSSAAHYAHSKKHPEIEDYYVYTMEVPDRTEDNWLPLMKKVPVPASIVARTEAKLGETLPPEAKVEGIPYRKYLANLLEGNRKTVKQMTDRASIEGEKAAGAFLLSIGIELIVWPVDWKKPEGEKNMAVLDESKVRILRIDKVDLNPKKNYEFIKGSERLVKQF